MGDGVLVYFGYPQAHENDAERAVRAGLDAIAAISRLDVKSVKLRTRVGIATGTVVVGDRIGRGPAQVQSVVGETPNLAARLQDLAEPDTVVIAAGTRRLVGDLFEYRELGAVKIRGIAAPVPVWQVLRPSIVASRFEALRGATLTGFVNREEEIEVLLRLWARAKAGNGQVVLISGEAGIGKSRIAAALGERLAGEAVTRPALFLLAVPSEQRAIPVCRISDASSRVRPRGSARAQAGKARFRAGCRGGGARRISPLSPIFCHCRPRIAIPSPS